MTSYCTVVFQEQISCLFFFKNATSVFQHFRSVKLALWKHNQEVFTAPWTIDRAPIRIIWQENSIEDIIIWWMRSLQLKWLRSLYTPFIQTRFSHRPQLLFNLLLWTQCQKWFNFTLWINNTWYSPSHSRLTARRAFIMLSTILSSIDDRAGWAPQAVGGNEVQFLYTSLWKLFQPWTWR